MIKKLYANKILLGFIVSNITAFVLIWLTKIISSTETGFYNPSVLIWSEFVLIPLLMGFVTAWIWRKLNLRGRKLASYSVINGFIAILLSAIVLKEGVICLLIVSPLIIGFILTGALIGRTMFRRNNQTLNVSFIGLIMVAFITDSLSIHRYENMVGDEIVINASPAEVWKHVVAFEGIKEPPAFWLFMAGMPAPYRTTVDDYKKGAGRKCIFSNGYTFDEKITVFDINKDLTFEIIGQPRDPEIMGHIDILKGQFLLKDNGNGTTTLVGNSWYKLYVFPAWYYDLWAKSITRNVHLRVMNHIKKLSEEK